MGFNERFLALRDVKRAVCQELQDKCSSLEDINSKLGIKENILVPSMLPSEEPERREEVTDADIAAFVADRDTAACSNVLDGFTGGESDANTTSKLASPVDKHAETSSLAASKPNGESLKAIMERLSAQYLPTPAEKIQRALYERRWKAQRDLLLKRINEITAKFDEGLMTLKHEKIELEKNLKAAEVQCIVLVREHALLVEFSGRDELLNSKLANKQGEQREIMAKIGQCQQQLKDQKVQLDNIAKRNAEIVGYFDSVVGDGHPYREQLVVIFNRKVKRAKRGAVDRVDDDDDDADDDDDDDDDSEDDDQQQVCPQGCDQALYDEVCVIREQRLDQEDIIADISKSCEQTRKEQEVLKQKLKRIDQSLAATESDIRDFQREKQAALNEIDVMVMLHAHQIEYLVDGRLPGDVSGAVVFSNRELTRLRHRIDELAAEKVQMRRTQKELRKQHTQLVKDKAAKEKALTELEARAYDVQMLKFGREIDIELLEQLGSTAGADELRAQLREQAKRFDAELREWDLKIAMRTEELVSLTQENTMHLNTVGELTSQQKSLEAGVRRTRKELNVDSVGARKREAAEREYLVDLIQSQAKEIDYLKGQINVLKRHLRRILLEEPRHCTMARSGATLFEGLNRWIERCNDGKTSEFFQLEVAGDPVGFVSKDVVGKLTSSLQDGQQSPFILRGEKLTLDPDLSTMESRNSAISEYLLQLKEQGLIDGWRDELYPASTDFNADPVLLVERAAAPLLGIKGYGVHMNGFVRKEDQIYLWVASRSKSKPTWPGQLDHIAAGGQPYGLSVSENMVKEAFEEAGISSKIARNAVAAGAVSYTSAYTYKSGCPGLKRDVLFVFDLEMPEDFNPRPVDGEVDEFKLMAVSEVIDIVAFGDMSCSFKDNCNLVLIDFFIRHGLLSPDSSGYLRLLSKLRSEECK